MEFNELKELIELFSKSQVDELDLEQEGLTLKLAKKKETFVAAPMVAAPSGGIVEAIPSVPDSEDVSDDEGLVFLTSPIVGTFYRAPGPNSDVFVKVGSSVHTGQTLCIIEAMKLMNEIQADHDGEVVKVLVENGQGVEYGQRLFALKPH